MVTTVRRSEFDVFRMYNGLFSGHFDFGLTSFPPVYIGQHGGGVEMLSSANLTMRGKKAKCTLVMFFTYYIGVVNG
jgi:hypothetical protein